MLIWSLRESRIESLPPEWPGCFTELRVAGQADVSENVVIRLAQAAEVGRSAARFHAEICSTFAQNPLEGGGLLLPKNPIQIGHANDLRPATLAADFTHCGSAVQVAQHHATGSEFGHRELRYDFRVWEFGYV